MKKLLLGLVFAISSFGQSGLLLRGAGGGGGSLDWGTVDAMIDGSGGTLTNLITATTLDNSTKGLANTTGNSISPDPTDAMRWDTSQCGLGAKVTIRGGSTYTAGTALKAISFDNSFAFEKAFQSIAGGQRILTVSWCHTFGEPDEGASANDFDPMGIYATDGGFVVAQFVNGNCNNDNTGYGMRLHTDGNGTLVTATCITFPLHSTVLFTLQSDETGGTARLAGYNPTTLQQFGSTLSLQQKTGADIFYIQYGNNEVGTPGSAGTKDYFDHIMIDYTTHAFPLTPH